MWPVVTEWQERGSQRFEEGRQQLRKRVELSMLGLNRLVHSELGPRDSLLAEKKWLLHVCGLKI